MQQDTSHLFVAFELPDAMPYPYDCGRGMGPAVQVFVDTDNDKASTPQTDDYRLTVTKSNTAHENRGNGSGWSSLGPPAGWSGAAGLWSEGWQAEFSVPFAKLDITAGIRKRIGLALAQVWTPSPLDNYWPVGGDWLRPDKWEKARSSAGWASWSWKADEWIDYAPHGLPDVGQRQNHWGNGFQWTYSCPAALADTL